MKKIFLIAIVVLMLFIVGCSSDEKATEKIEENDDVNNVEQESVDSNKVIEIKDPELEKIVREKINKVEGDILASDMAEIETININYADNPVYEIDGLEYAINLRDFSFRNEGKLKSLEPISSLKNLEYLGMSYSTIEIMPSNFNTPAIERITFIETNISDYDFLKNSTKMTEIIINDSGVISTDFLSNMKELESLNLKYNEITDITSVKDKTKLTVIDLHMNNVGDISVLSTCESLIQVNISYNSISNIESLYNLEALTLVTAYESIGEAMIPLTQIATLEANEVYVSYHE